MDIRKLETKDLIQAKKLWKQAFGDSDKYIEHNFAVNLNLDNSLATFVDGKLACMLFMLPKLIKIGQTEIATYFIAGVSTDNDYRYQGHAKRLMEHAHGFIKANKMPFVFLYPFNHDFYRKLGYETVNMMNKIEFDINALEFSNNEYYFDIIKINSEKNISRLLDIYNEYSKKFDGYFYRKTSDFDKIVDTVLLEDGNILIISKQNRDVGYIIYYLDGDRIECVESVFLDGKSANITKDYLSQQHNGFFYADCDYDISDAKLIEYAMVKNIDKDVCFDLSQKILILEQY